MSERIIVAHDRDMPDGNVYADQISDAEAPIQHDWIKHEADLAVPDHTPIVVPVSLCGNCGLIVPGHAVGTRRLPPCGGEEAWDFHLIGTRE